MLRHLEKYRVYSRLLVGLHYMKLAVRDKQPFASCFLGVLEGSKRGDLTSLIFIAYPTYDCISVDIVWVKVRGP